jgi:hypothetical protein
VTERFIEDGFGGRWPKCEKPDCQLEVVRPGKVQCGDCECPDVPVGDTGVGAWEAHKTALHFIESLANYVNQLPLDALESYLERLLDVGTTPALERRVLRALRILAITRQWAEAIARELADEPKDPRASASAAFGFGGPRRPEEP